MKHEIEDAPGQRLLFDIGSPKRRKPTPSELEEVLIDKARAAVYRWHRGRTLKHEYEELIQSVIAGALKRLKNFRHGGPINLQRFTYMACYQALRDVQRANQKYYGPRGPKSYPLWEDEV